MLIDSKGKLFGKISIVDILIVVIIIGAFAGVAYKLKKSNVVSPLANTSKVQVVLYTDSTTESSSKKIKIGDDVKDRATGTVLGKVTNIEAGPSVIYGTDSEGNVVVSTKPNYVFLKISVEGKGVYTDTGVTFGSTSYYINQSMYETRVGSAVFTVSVNDIKKL